MKMNELNFNMMTNNMTLPFEKAICYSGFRDGQSPITHVYPSYEEIKEDLLLLQHDWKYLRLYNCNKHAETVLRVIEQEGFDFKVLAGAYIMAEVNNPNCPWGGGEYSDKELEEHKEVNKVRIQKLIRLANNYPTIINSLSVGNEAAVDWTDHLVPTESIIAYAKEVQDNTEQPVTFCENYVPWLDKLKPLGEQLDFISIHTYPVWENKTVHEALEYTKQNYNAVQEAYPNKQIVITEAGWATKSNGRGINPEHVNEAFQKEYIEQLMQWCEEEKILTYVFEAFDENWKGSQEALEPEKHWGLYFANRKPKMVVAVK